MSLKEEMDQEKMSGVSGNNSGILIDLNADVEAVPFSDPLKNQAEFDGTFGLDVFSGNQILFHQTEDEKSVGSPTPTSKCMTLNDFFSPVLMKEQVIKSEDQVSSIRKETGPIHQAPRAEDKENLISWTLSDESGLITASPHPDTSSISLTDCNKHQLNVDYIESKLHNLCLQEEDDKDSLDDYWSAEEIAKLPELCEENDFDLASLMDFELIQMKKRAGIVCEAIKQQIIDKEKLRILGEECGYLTKDSGVEKSFCICNFDSYYDMVLSLSRPIKNSQVKSKFKLLDAYAHDDSQRMISNDVKVQGLKRSNSMPSPKVSIPIIPIIPYRVPSVQNVNKVSNYDETKKSLDATFNSVSELKTHGKTDKLECFNETVSLGKGDITLSQESLYSDLNVTKTVSNGNSSNLRIRAKSSSDNIAEKTITLDSKNISSASDQQGPGIRYHQIQPASSKPREQVSFPKLTKLPSTWSSQSIKKRGNIVGSSKNQPLKAIHSTLPKVTAQSQTAKNAATNSSSCLARASSMKSKDKPNPNARTSLSAENSPKRSQLTKKFDISPIVSMSNARNRGIPTPSKNHAPNFSSSTPAANRTVKRCRSFNSPSNSSHEFSNAKKTNLNESLNSTYTETRSRPYSALPSSSKSSSLFAAKDGKNRKPLTKPPIIGSTVGGSGIPKPKSIVGKNKFSGIPMPKK